MKMNPATVNVKKAGRYTRAPITADDVPALLRKIPRMGNTPGAVALSQIAGLGMAAVPALLDGTKDKSEKVQGLAWVVLSRVRGPEMGPIMLEKLGCSSSFARLFILSSLKVNGDARAVEPLRRFIALVRPLADGHDLGHMLAGSNVSAAEAALAAIETREAEAAPGAPALQT